MILCLAANVVSVDSSHCSGMESSSTWRLTILVTLMQDTDLFADMGPTAVEDAWQWLPLQARRTLVHFLGHLPQLAGQLSNSNPESRAKLDNALQQLLEGAELTSAQRNALKMATELVVCGEEVSHPHDICRFTNGVCVAVQTIMPKDPCSTLYTIAEKCTWNTDCAGTTS